MLHSLLIQDGFLCVCVEAGGGVEAWETYGLLGVSAVDWKEKTVGTHRLTAGGQNRGVFTDPGSV